MNRERWSILALTASWVLIAWAGYCVGHRDGLGRTSEMVPVREVSVVPWPDEAMPYNHWEVKEDVRNFRLFGFIPEDQR